MRFYYAIEVVVPWSDRLLGAMHQNEATLDSWKVGYVFFALPPTSTSTTR